MTAREYAKECGVEVVGKLTRKVSTTEEYDFIKDEVVVIKNIVYIDEAGTEFLQGNKKYKGWCIVLPDGGVI